MTANPESPPKINWEYYKKNVANPGLVDKFQKEYEAMSVPYPTDKYTAQIEAEGKEVAAQIDNFIKESNKIIEESQQEIQRIKSLLPFDQMTMEDFKDLYPEVAFDPERPTMWPHTPEAQPSAAPQSTDKHH